MTGFDLQWPGLAYHLINEIQPSHLLKRSSERGGVNLLVVSPKRVSHLKWVQATFYFRVWICLDVSYTPTKATQQLLKDNARTIFTVLCGKSKDFVRFSG